MKFPHFHLLDPFQQVFQHIRNQFKSPEKKGLCGIIFKNYYKIFFDLVVVDICLKISGLTLGVER